MKRGEEMRCSSPGDFGGEKQGQRDSLPHWQITHRWRTDRRALRGLVFDPESYRGLLRVTFPCQERMKF